MNKYLSCVPGVDGKIHPHQEHMKNTCNIAARPNQYISNKKGTVWKSFDNIQSSKPALID